MRWVALFSILALCGCQNSGKEKTIGWLQTQGMDRSSATILAHNKPALRQYVMNKVMAKQDDDYCRSLGAAVGTPAYVQCRTSVSAGRNVSDPPAPRSEPLNCRTNVVLGTLKTSCD